MILKLVASFIFFPHPPINHIILNITVIGMCCNNRFIPCNFYFCSILKKKDFFFYGDNKLSYTIRNHGKWRQLKKKKTKKINERDPHIKGWLPKKKSKQWEIKTSHAVDFFWIWSDLEDLLDGFDFFWRWGNTIWKL